MGLYFSLVRKDGSPVEAITDPYNFPDTIDNLSFNKPSFHYSDGGIYQFVGGNPPRKGCDYFLPDWEGIRRRAAENLVESMWALVAAGELTDYHPQKCTCVTCLRNEYEEVLRMWIIADFVLHTPDPSDYGFNWSP